MASGIDNGVKPVSLAMHSSHVSHATAKYCATDHNPPRFVHQFPDLNQLGPRSMALRRIFPGATEWLRLIDPSAARKNPPTQALSA
ncbi:hypothetical protein [Verminephrobacter aporrectodeae]|uniref:hypothetical protein n=1 Tax=Verminephrobacter aporrectodeae TaxID=1110389 RepID=UPI002244172E|nr:hypothetical protein [Verminephrobacter aporrectodeae]